MLEKSLAKRPYLVPLILLIGCFLFYSNAYPFKSEVFWGFDLREYTYPYFDFLRHEVLQHGELPLWNPHQFIGFSMIGNGEVNLFYPPNWLIYVMPVRQAVAINLILHTFIGMWGISAFGRQLGVSRLGAILIGLMWGGCGTIGARIWSGHYTLILPLAWMMWVFAGYLYASKRSTWTSGIVCGMGLALLPISGHPQISLMAGFGLLILWLWRCTDFPFWQATRPLLIMGISSVLLASVAILPVLETAASSERASDERDIYKFADSYSMPANQLLVMVFPDLMGSQDFMWGDWNYDELSPYAGLLCFIALAILLQNPKRELWLLIGFGGFGLIMALALDGGLLQLMIQVVPQMGMFRSAARWLIFTEIALICIAGLLITYLQNASFRELSATLLPVVNSWLPKAVLLCFGLAFILSFGRTIHRDAVHQQRWWEAGETIATTGIILMLMAFTLMKFRTAPSQWTLLLLIGLGILDTWRITLPLMYVGDEATYEQHWYDLTYDLPVEEAGTWRIFIDPNFRTTYNSPTGIGFYSVHGYESLQADDYQRWFRADYNAFSLTQMMSGIRYVIRGEPFPEDRRITLKSDVGGLHIYEIKEPIPRAYFAQQIAILENDQEVIDYFKHSAETHTTAVLDQKPACEGTTGNAEILEYRPNRVELWVSSETGGLLILSDRYDTGWKAKVSGKETPIYRADTIYRAICVPPGEHNVVFSYEPRSLYIGGVISIMSWVGAVLIVVVTYATRGI